MDKAARRRQARTLPSATARESAAVVARLRELDQLRVAERVCVYLPMDGEVDLRPLTEQRRDLDWVTTRTGAGPDLTVHDLDAPRERHRLGYDQPMASSAIVAPDTVDLWLVPGLAFDPHGTRLGHGRGYYDRLLARRHADAVVVGITTERRLVADLPHEDHDVRMDLVVTDVTMRPTTVPG